MLVIFVIAAGGLYFSLTGMPYKKSHIANEVRDYLVHTRSYTAADIQEIRGVYSFKSGDYEAEVRFKDEPGVNYTYTKVDGAFRLTGVSNLYGNHIDETFF